MKSPSTNLKILRNIFTMLVVISLISSRAYAVKKSSNTSSVICTNSTGALITRPKKCKKNETKLDLSKISSIVSTSGPQGQKGEPGLDGPDGQLKIYGDGSAGDVVLSGFGQLAADNKQFNNLTIAAGANINVPSGTVIRCKGTFVNNGNLYAGFYAGPGERASDHSLRTAPSAGMTRRAAIMGDYGTSAVTLNGGTGGQGIGLEEARNIFNPGPLGGGGSAAGGNFGFPGGGTMVILAKGAISNPGKIYAYGADSLRAGISFQVGFGAGGGGIAILASKTSIDNSGIVDVSGGLGCESSTFASPGGGGGGGLIHFIAPSISSTGQANIAGGLRGPGFTNVSHSPRTAGGGGGAAVGDGGTGETIDTAGNVSGGADGGVGVFYKSLEDPTALF